MSHSRATQDAVIIGGGFYGAVIAIYLAKVRNFKKISLIEREPKLLIRASYNNQARVHNGYHYPRSFKTAFRSRVNYPNFLNNWSDSIKNDFTSLYAISRNNSKITGNQFERFCNEIGAKISIPPHSLIKLFNPRMIENVFMVEECAFDAARLSTHIRRDLEECGIQILLDTEATQISQGSNSNLITTIKANNCVEQNISSKFLFNCTYSRLNQFSGKSKFQEINLKHEIAEIALIEMPTTISALGITVMDGPFFSAMPFPAKNLHSLSHVRFTPHMQWTDNHGIEPYEKLEKYKRLSRSNRMLRDAARYMPAIQNAKYIESLFEVKTTLTRNETDDGRPILFERDSRLSGCFSILGGKIDNIYDILEKLNSEQFAL